jgi:hypothetical protein
MATTLKRAYSGKDVDMLTACGTIIEQAITHKTFLVSKRSNWADPFLPNIKTRIKNAFSNFLGIDSAQQMRDATQIVTDIQKNALNDLAEFKVQIMEDFKSNKKHRDEILNRLGFTAHHKPAQAKSQESLIELLLSFKTNMTAVLQKEITKAGTKAALITAIIGYADVLRSSNITQETSKGSRKEVSQAGVTEFNAIYTQVISIAKISAKFFKDDKAIKDEFSFSKAMGKGNSAKATQSAPPVVPIVPPKTPPTTP